MASRTTLNAKNLATLGAERLAELLIEISKGSALAKRRLRLELAGAQSPKEAGREVAKRLASIARSKSRVNWRSRKALVTDLETQLRAITEQIAPVDPAEALSLLWRFTQIATSLFDRTDDSSGVLAELFRRAAAQLGPLAMAADGPPETLAEAAFAALQDNDYGQYDGLIEILTPALGPKGLARLKAKVEAYAAESVVLPPKSEWRAFGYGSNPAYAQQMAERARARLVQAALLDLADAMGDVDGFIAQYDAQARQVPGIAADIAERLLKAGRAAEALAALDAASVRDAPEEWRAARLAALEALGRADEAQAFRLAAFEQSLSADYLRQYLRRLPDFDDVEAEEAAMDHARKHPNVLAALRFFLDWPAPYAAVELVQARAAEIDGDHYELLTPAAEALATRYPLAATLLLRAMIDFTLRKARAARYSYAAQHLLDCAVLAAEIPEFGEIEPHNDYVSRLRRDHSRKSAFWAYFA